MSLLDSFTGPKWQHTNPQIRKQAIEQLDDQGILLELVNSDPDAAVQSAALSRIDDSDLLDELIQTLPQGLRQQARNQRLRQILPSADRLAEIEDDAVLQRIIHLSDDPELVVEAVARIRSDAVRMELASNHPLAKVRLSAALGLEQIDLLGELMQRARGRDKAVFRHCKTLIDEHHATQQDAAQRQEKIRQLCARAKVLAEAVDSPDYANDYRVLAAQWKTVKASASAAQQEQFQLDQARCAQRLVRQADARAADEQAQAQRAAAEQTFAGIIDELEQLGHALSPLGERPALMELSERLDDIESRWQGARGLAQPAAGQARACARHLALWRSAGRTAQRLQDHAAELGNILGDAESADGSDYAALQQQIERSEKMLASLSWPDSVSAPAPAQIAQLQQALLQLRGQLAALDRDQGQHVARVQNLITRLRSELDQNRSKQADRALNGARKSLKALAPKQRQHFEQELIPLAARLQEVHDWQAFAVEPKKVDLCARMTALIGSGEDADLLAVKIKSLQDEWKQLGGLPNARERVLWMEFKAAADEAWKPCKQAFAQRAELRRQNFEKRMQLVAQLKEYEEKMAWPQDGAGSDEAGPGTGASAPDWRAVQKTLDVARAAFRGIKPLDHKQERLSGRAFRAVCDRIYGHIRQEYERNIACKERLLSSARELAVAEDLPQAINGCKRLQREWKEVGVTPLAADRKLWKSFRAACDAVFARMEEQRSRQTAELDARVKQAESLRDQARALLAAQDEQQDPQLHKTLSELKQELNRIELPARVQQRLGKDFQSIEKQVRDAAVEIRRRREQASWVRLREKIIACALQPADEGGATNMWQGSSDLPKGVDAAALESFWQQGPGDAAEGQLREACIGLEIFGAIDSPAEDKEARLKYQMQRLVAGMGRRGDLAEPSLEDRINALIALRPAAQWAQRFCAALEKIKA